MHFARPSEGIAMGKHVAAWFTTFVLDMVAVPVLAYLMGDTGAVLGMAAGGVALAGVAVAAAVDGAVGAVALLLLVPVGLAAPAGVVTSAEVAAGRPVASVVRGEEAGSGTTVPLGDPGVRSEVGVPGESSPCAEDAVLAEGSGTCPPTVVSVPSEGATGGPDGGSEDGTQGGAEQGGAEDVGGTDGSGGTGTGGSTGEGSGGTGGGPSPGVSTGP
ncbi:hypothetical protein [Nocardiopsis suaedae]|uniref:Uncharacterized protein n=1 Tax=Nocardiopsis suaedae TaxID=3018444 RepID=A0ABT4THX5_9ACTN|nr:hypothetical protein [Nocardiopsis suaedae]MDA2804309.1 hypothetical protein [Nocardiopsis suaedae]